MEWGKTYGELIKMAGSEFKSNNALLPLLQET